MSRYVIGIPKEMKEGEKRVALPPVQVGRLVKKGCAVWVEKGAGEGAGFLDVHYRAVGAKIVSKDRVWEASLIAKVKEPLPAEYPFLWEGQILFTFLHLSANEKLARFLLKKKVTGIALETIRTKGKNPVLAPMSRLAGALSVFLGQTYLFSPRGYGILLEHLPEIGAEQGRVIILGAGMVGTEAARVASALKSDVLVFDKDVERLRGLKRQFPRVRIASDSYQVQRALSKTHLLIGAIYVPGDRPPLVISREWVEKMPSHSVTLDVAVDQGGCIYPRRIGTLKQPTFSDTEGRIHVRIPNMPALVPRTATFSLSKVTFPYLAAMAREGLSAAFKRYPELLLGVNTYEGHLTCKPVGKLFKIPYKDLNEVLQFSHVR